MSASRVDRDGAFGLLSIASALPARESVAELARRAGYDDAMVERLHSGGLNEVPVAPPGPLTVLAAQAASAALQLAGSPPVGAVVFAHSVPALAPVDTPFLEDLLVQVGVPPSPSIAVTGQPCAVLHAALKLAGAWSLALPPSQCVLLVGADRAYLPGQRIFFGSTMGDAAVAMAVARNTDGHRILASYQHTMVLATQGELSAPDRIAAFREQNPAQIRSAIASCIAMAGCRLDDVALILPHTPYLAIWDAVARLTGFPRERILTDYIGDTGHLNSNDSFVHYERAVRENRLKRDSLALLVNPGFGGTRGCTLIKR